MNNFQLPSKTRVAIMGGGIVGCSTAYHLSKLGWKDIIVIEKGELTSGSTWHAAGLVGQLRSSRNMTRMLKYSVELYRNLEKETGQPTGWKEVGGLRIASSKSRLIELKKAATTAKSFGLEMQMLSAREAYDLFPLMSTDGIEGAAFLPTDGYTDPSQVTMALSKGARNGGVRFFRHVRVTGLECSDERVTKILTDHGDVEAEIIVNAAGIWSRELGKMAGVNIPLIPVQHQFLVTDQIPDMPTGLPTMRDPDHLVYYKEEAGGLVMGGYEKNPIPWNINGIPKEFGQELIDSDFDHFETLYNLATKRTPVLNTVGVRKLINGPEAFTTDGHFIMGLAPEKKNFYVATGFNAHGIAAGGGAGKMMAEWIAFGEPSLDLWEVDIRRFGGYHKSIQYVRDRTAELYGKHYAMNWPFDEHESARGIRKSPLHETLKKNGAVFGAKFGWERANWYAPKGVEPKDELTYGTPNWFEHVGNEHKAVRENVALMDQTPFSKFKIEGSGATEFLNWLAVANVDRPVGSIIYTQLCNEKGGIEADLTFQRLGKNEYYVVTGTAFATHDFHWIKSHMPEDGSVVLNDITSSKAVINVCGPKSRTLLQRVSDANLSNEAFAFAQVREIHIGHAPVLAARVTYVGELGWELHVPTEYACHVYEKLWENGQDLGITHAGYRAIESLRLEKGYRYWSTDLTPDYTPYEAGLGFCVDLKKKDFLGKAALEKAKKDGPRERLCCFVMDKKTLLFGGETIKRNGEVLGVVTSGGYGYTVGKTIAFGYVPREKAKETDFVIERFGEDIPAKRHKGAVYDPERKKILS